MGFVPSVFSVVSPFVVLARLKVHSVCPAALGLYFVCWSSSRVVDIVSLFVLLTG